MPLILNRPDVLALYAEAIRSQWVIPAFGTENLTTTEAILTALRDHGELIGRPDLPVTVAITHRYPERSQSRYYTHTRDASLGLRLFFSDIRTLTAPGSPFAHLRVMVHLDHGQHDLDADILHSAAGAFSSVMFDASTLPLEENIAATRRYVATYGGHLVIEGACESIAHAGEAAASAFTDPGEVERYQRDTGVDLVVANLGTEHRAGASTLCYRSDLARMICSRIGARLCLHGASSVAPDRLRCLHQDGVAKVNLWTALERDSSTTLLAELCAHAGQVAGSAAASALVSAGRLGPKSGAEHPSDLIFCTTAYRQEVVFASMCRQVRSYLKLWFPAPP